MKRMMLPLTVLFLAGLFLAPTPVEAHRWSYPMSASYYGPGLGPWHYPWSLAYLYPPRQTTFTIHPSLAVVDTDISPGHTRLYLDGDFIGTADRFDGIPDFLYLGEGSYTLECKLGGYVDQTLDIEVDKLNHYQIKLRMERIKGEPRESYWDRARGPDPIVRVFESTRPSQGQAGATGRRDSRTRSLSTPGGPDLRLRPDLQGEPRVERPARPDDARTEASLSFRITPPHAAVYLDGAFLGTAGELERAKRPMLMNPGEHVLEILAPDIEPTQKAIKVKPGETMEIEINATAR